eukprot:3476143-Karenia_brevis.AAC.1
MSVWARYVEHRVPDSLAESYADDTQVIAATRSAITTVGDCTDNFVRLSGQSLNAGKSFAFTTVLGGRKTVAVGSQRVSWKTSGRILGA